VLHLLGLWGKRFYCRTAAAYRSSKIRNYLGIGGSFHAQGPKSLDHTAPGCCHPIKTTSHRGPFLIQIWFSFPFQFWAQEWFDFFGGIEGTDRLWQLIKKVVPHSFFIAVVYRAAWLSLCIPVWSFPLFILSLFFIVRRLFYLNVLISFPEKSGG